MYRLLALGVVAGCAAPASSPAPDAGGPPVSFATDVAPLINHCGSENCHGGLGASWPRSSLVGVAANECADSPRTLVVPGDPGTSYLLAKLAGTDMCSGHRMPLGGTAFTADQMQLVAAWIAQGALDN